MMETEERNEQQVPEGVAIIGMAGRFPGADSVEQFWKNLCDGVEAITFFTDEELRAAGVPSDLLSDPLYVKAGAVLPDADKWDAAFFGFTPREAEVIDPQHRLFLEVAWEAFENAGYNAERYDGQIGVYAGAGLNRYMLFNVFPNRHRIARTIGEHPLFVGNDKDFLATRVSYKLNLKGPSMNIQSACSTSAVAVHMACQSLLGGESDMVLAGGVTVGVPFVGGYLHQQGMTSADGHCRPFDANSSGTVFGSGAGALVLKRLEDAMADGDTIYAVIRGSAVNNDGSNKMSYTAPSVEGQVGAISEALGLADIDPRTVSYIETHGTATAIGDPIEVEGLTKVFRTQTEDTGFCAIGSVKSNFGHLDTAAGVAALMKTALSLTHKKLPPTLHYTAPNPRIDFANSPFFVNDKLTEWQSDGPRRAGVSSFGFGGTNVHLVLEEAPEQEETSASREWQLLLLSARSETALNAMTANLHAHLEANPELDLADVAYTLQVGRKPFAHKRAAVVRDREDALRVLAGQEPLRLLSGRQEQTGELPIAFLFSGMGSQYVNMGRDLYETEPDFQDAVDACCEKFLPHVGLDLLDLLYPQEGEEEQAAALLTETRYMQPALFVLEYALSQLVMKWGIKPRAMIGHSFGEYVAATLSGVFDLDGVTKLIAKRAQLMHSTEAGAMLAVSLPEAEVLPLLGTNLAVASVNEPLQTVVSGSIAAVDALEATLKIKGINTNRVRVINAPHSHLMDPILAEFAEAVRSVNPQAPQLPFVSNVTGDWITDEQATDPQYWADHLRGTVRFWDGLQTLTHGQKMILLEIGPGRTLSTFAKQVKGQDAPVVLRTVRSFKETYDDAQFLFMTLGQLCFAGADVDWTGFYDGEIRRRVPLPTYPFERQRYWLEAPEEMFASGSAGTTSAEETEQTPISEKSASSYSRPNLPTPYAAPETEEQGKIVEYWQDLLGIEPVGIYDDFFELGGNSLLAARFMTRLRSGFGIDMPLQVIFETGNVAALSARVLQEVEAGGGLAEKEVIPLRQNREDAPLSFAQQRMWFLDRLLPDGSVYNIPNALRLTGRMDLDALERGVSEIYRRHDVLRSVYQDQDGEPVQVIAPYSPIVLERTELANVPVEEREAVSARLVLEEASWRFDLEKGPLLRGQVVRFAEEDHLLVLNMHHIVTDGWSMGVFVQEIKALYEAFSQGKPSPLPELTVQYADFADWQKDRLQGERMEEQLAYWREKLSGEIQVLQLPTDRPRPAMHSYRGRAKFFRLSDTLTKKLNELSQKQGVTLYMTMMAAFKTLLYRCTGQKDLLVGTPIAGRTHEELEGLIGFFVNTLVLRTELSDELTFADLLTRVRDGAMEMYSHQEVPFERLVEELQPERNMGITPFFQVMFALQNVPVSELKLPELTMEVLEVDNGTSKFDMTLMMTERGEELAGTLEYNTDLFDAATIERFVSHYETLLTAIAEAPEQKLWELPLLSDAERTQLLVEWNDTSVPFPEQLCLHHLFEEQVTRTPQNIAVVDGGRTYTYAELDVMSNRLAHHLQALGVCPDAPVGMLIDRSAEMVVALLAILKAGGAYVPLDSEAPPARVEQVLSEAQANVCLTQEHLYGNIPARVNAVVLSAEGMTGASMYPDTAPASDVQPEHLVSIYYTSGSTGKPKGVASTHRGWVNRMCWMQNQHNLQATESVLQKTTLTFDDAAVEFFWPLMVGARIVMLEPSLHKDPRAIIDAAVAHQAAVLQFVPTMLALVVDALTPQDLDGLGSLRLVVSSGEALRSDLVRRFDELLDLHRVHLTNTWGATEVSIDSTIHTCKPQDGRGTEIVSVGRPIDNNKVYILDAHLSPVPIGVAGDLYLAGVGLARNYLNNPERTMEAFLLDPFQSGERMYKTGDRGYYRADGSIMFLGRTDDQIKVRGQRVELGEIEAVLASHPAVKHCAVAAHKRPDGYALHGYYLAAVDGVPEPVLRAYMAERLPDYMVPKRIVALDELPFTVSGKVDRKLLPDPGDARPELLTNFVEAGSAVEEVIAGVWAEILGVEEVGVHDKFFDLGGHSLDATRIVSRINKEIGVQLPLRALFETPTVAGLAQAVDKLIQAGGVALDAPITRLPEQDHYELSNAQKRLWLEFQLTEERSLGFTFPLRLLGKLDVTALQQAFQEVAARHGIMRTTYDEADGKPYQIVHGGLEIPFVYEDLTSFAQGEREEQLAERVMEVAAQSRFNLRQGPLFRMFLYKVNEGDYLTLLSLHHIGYDGWSYNVMMQDIAALYRSYKTGEPHELPRAVQYVDFAAWQNERLASGAMDGQKEFWLQQLQGFTARPQLPGVEDVPQEERALSAVHRHVIPAELTEKLRRFAADNGKTLYVTALSAFNIWLAQTSGQTDVTVGSPTSGRVHQDLEGVMGLLVNPVVMRTVLDDNPTGLQVLDRVNQSAMQAYAHQEYPYDFVVNDLRREHGVTGTLYSIIFVGQNTNTEIQVDEDVTFEITWLENILPEEKLARLNFAADVAQGDFDLHIELYEEESELLLRTQFNAARFRTETVEEFMRQYESMLEQLTQDPEKRLSQFELELADVIDDLF